jgi:glutamate-1-semialdehyde 2,1-aminomutase
LATQGIPASPGVLESATAATVIAPWNAPQALPDTRDLAAILLEPVPANMGVVPAEPGFLQTLRRAADESGALLIFDEVITGFRIARGGAQQLYGIDPDLTIMGKIMGGGLPAAAYGGRRDLMERIAPAGDVYQAGTLSGNPLATAAALATLEQLDAAAYERLGRVTEALAGGLRDAAAAAGRPVQIHTVPGLLTVFFSAHPIGDYAAAASCDTEAYGAWCRGLLARGVYPPPSQFEAWFPSLAHSDGDVARTVQAAAEAFAEIAPR